MIGAAVYASTVYEVVVRHYANCMCVVRILIVVVAVTVSVVVVDARVVDVDVAPIAVAVVIPRVVRFAPAEREPANAAAETKTEANAAATGRHRSQRKPGPKTDEHSQGRGTSPSGCRYRPSGRSGTAQNPKAHSQPRSTPRGRHSSSSHCYREPSRLHAFGYQTWPYSGSSFQVPLSSRSL